MSEVNIEEMNRYSNPDINFEIIRKRTLREMGEEFEEEFGRDSYNKKNQSNNAPRGPRRFPSPHFPRTSLSFVRWSYR